VVPTTLLETFIKISLILFLLLPQQVQSKEKNLQFQFGDEVSIFSDKAYRKRKGELFEAVGNVVILHKKDTLYGQSASFDMKNGTFKLQGNVRYISENLTLYGSILEFNMKTGQLLMENARVVSETFNIVAKRVEKKTKVDYYAEDAEFSTCRNCPESWSIYGEKIDLTIGEYVTIRNGLIKTNGIEIMIIPYIVLPIKKDRESGLLFPVFSQRNNEGVAVLQPWFWAISEDKDMTLSPAFWASRGYGTDIQYRQAFSQYEWMELNSRVLSDEIYLPGKLDSSDSGTETFRHFTEAEAHLQPNHNLNSHIRYTELRDLDMVKEFSNYTDSRIIGSEVGFNGYLDYRHDLFNFSFQAEFNKNQLSNTADQFDNDYVQVLPSTEFSLMPIELYKSDTLMLNRISFGMDSSFTKFRQNVFNETTQLRNADRLTLDPYIDWNFFTRGPFNLKTRYIFNLQNYQFEAPGENDYRKNANIMRTEFSFSVDKIFGLAYEEKLPIEKVKEESLASIKKQKDKKKGKKKKRVKQTIGEIPSFERSLKEDYVKVKRHSFRHSQEFKFIHHYIFDESQGGSQNFHNQITTNSSGWFDYADAIRSQETELGSNDTRMLISPSNTLEFQWNNMLIKKSPRKYTYLEDNKFLKDNFSYRKMGYFNLSQGVEIGGRQGSFKDRLTRLYIDTGVDFDTWGLGIEEYYFHQSSDNILSSYFYKYFDMVQVYGKYNLNSLQQIELKTFTAGVQLRPIDLFSFAYVKEFDLNADRTIRDQYYLRYVPRNNCYVLSLGYKETIVDRGWSFDLSFNFGSESFKREQRGSTIQEKI
jgi:LPS-assembly protein